MINAFGTIALVAMTPTVSIQIVGVLYKIKLSHSKSAVVEDMDILIIESLGEDYLKATEEKPTPEIDVSAITDTEDDIEIIDLPCDYEEKSSDSAKV